jgi:hypothetical protein
MVIPTGLEPVTSTTSSFQDLHYGYMVPHFTTNLRIKEMGQPSDPSMFFKNLSLIFQVGSYQPLDIPLPIIDTIKLFQDVLIRV